jgi:hypothetical protein
LASLKRIKKQEREKGKRKQEVGRPQAIREEDWVRRWKKEKMAL